MTGGLLLLSVGPPSVVVLTLVPPSVFRRFRPSWVCYRQTPHLNVLNLWSPSVRNRVSPEV